MSRQDSSEHQNQTKSDVGPLKVTRYPIFENF
jgi:hypothetical protein